MSVPRKQDGWRPGTPQDLETMYHFKQRFRELKMLLELIESGKLDMKVIRGLLPPEMDSDAANKKYVDDGLADKVFFTDSGNANYRNGLQYSGSPTKPLYMAVWDADDSATGTQPNRRVRSIEAADARALMGAAPAGYGYGGKSVSLKNAANITSEEELNTELAKVYDAMVAGETKMITWIMYPLTSGWRWFGILSKSSENNGSLIAHSAYGGGSNIVKTKNSGNWLPCEWENPPMVAGYEYRTTERWNGKPVYKKLIEYTNSVAISGAMTLNVPHGIANLDMMLTANCTTSGYLLPYVTAGSSLSISAWNSTNLTMYGNSSWGAGRKWYIEMRYTKTS